MDQKKKTGLMLIGAAALVVLTAGAMMMKEKGKEPEEQPQNVYHDIQDGEIQEVPSSKSDAYMSYSGSGNIEDYWDDCEEDIDSIIETEPEPVRTGGAATTEDLFGSTQPQPAPARTGSSSSGTPHRETAKEREERHQKHREEAIELANDIQRRHEQGDADIPPEDSPATAIVPQTIELSQESPVRRSGVISSLDDGWDGGGVSSLDEPSGSYAADDTHPFKCMFVREEKIKGGQRVSIRLLEDMLVGNVLIPRNSHLMATCSISGRLELEIANVEMQGRILALGYEAYDTDGTRGIYCPDAGDNISQTARSKGTTLAGTALRSRVGRVAGDVISTGISLVESSSGERTVTVPAGYTFFIVRKRNP